MFNMNVYGKIKKQPVVLLGVVSYSPGKEITQFNAYGLVAFSAVSSNLIIPDTLKKMVDIVHRVNWPSSPRCSGVCQHGSPHANCH